MSHLRPCVSDSDVTHRGSVVIAPLAECRSVPHSAARDSCPRNSWRGNSRSDYREEHGGGIVHQGFMHEVTGLKVYNGIGNSHGPPERKEFRAPKGRLGCQS